MKLRFASPFMLVGNYEYGTLSSFYIETNYHMETDVEKITVNQVKNIEIQFRFEWIEDCGDPLKNASVIFNMTLFQPE